MSVTSATEVDVRDSSYTTTTTTEVDNVGERKNEKSRWDNRWTKRDSRHRDSATTIGQMCHLKSFFIFFYSEDFSNEKIFNKILLILKYYKVK